MTTNDRQLVRGSSRLGGSKEDSIGRPQLRPSDLTAQHRQLVAEHHDLQLLELLRAKTQRRELQHAAKHEVAERPQQRPAPPWATRRAPTLRIRGRNRVNAPHRVAEAGDEQRDPASEPLVRALGAGDAAGGGELLGVARAAERLHGIGAEP